MTREKMTEMLSETISVTREEAQAALEAREWNILDAGRPAGNHRGDRADADALFARTVHPEYDGA